MIKVRTQKKYVAIKNLPQDKLLMVNSSLLAGAPPLTVARMIRGWGQMMKQPEHILAKQLVGYRSEIAHVVEDPEDGVVYITPSQGQLDAMDELQWLASQQKARVQALLTKEQTENKVSIMTTTEINQYGMILKDVLKAEFECGRREFKGPVGGKSSTSFTVNPNPQGGIDVTVTEAIEAAQKIMKRVPLLIEAQRAK